MDGKKDEEILLKEKEQKLQKLFKELDYSVKKDQHRLSWVVVEAIQKIDPENERIKEYLEKLPQPTEENSGLDIKSFMKLGAILITPGLLLFLVFYKFVQNSEHNNKEYFENIDATKGKEVSDNDKASKMKESLKKLQKNMLKDKPTDNQLSGKNKFKFSTTLSHTATQSPLLKQNPFIYNRYLIQRQNPQFNFLQGSLIKLLKKLV